LRDGEAMGHKAPSSVVVGLSSGVDSSVAAWLLKERGFNVIGVTFALAQPGASEQSNSCCSPTLMGRAKAIADHLGIPHYAVDMTDEFRGRVVDYFVAEYAEGRTPNPCSKCNARIRFGGLAEVARRLGAEWVATGHYARLEGSPSRIARGVDRQKDQSYVLAEVAPGLLESCLFPLGGLTKHQVRVIAWKVGLGKLVSEESQEICFIPGDDYRAFLTDRLGERPGDIVDEQGSPMGRHAGTYNYTVGQRRGLGFGGGRPLYVTKVDAARGEVVVAAEPTSRTRAIEFRVSAVHRELPRGHVSVQYRSMGNPVDGTLDGTECVLLDQAVGGVAAGQTIVIYDGERVVLGGTISGTAP
jgi:tRNA-specific 2-thiouridylase